MEVSEASIVSHTQFLWAIGLMGDWDAEFFSAVVLLR